MDRRTYWRRVEGDEAKKISNDISDFGFMGLMVLI